MATSIFDDKAILPTNEMVNTVIGKTSNLWEKLNSLVLKTYEGVVPEWKFPSKKAGWTLVFKQSKRALFYFIPCDSFFMITLVYGSKAENEAMNSDIPKKIKTAIKSATSYVEGKSFFVEVKTKSDFDAVVTLLKIKNMY
jgi:hypothetical protein